MKNKTIIFLFLTTISIQTFGQKKKVEYLDTLGNKVDFMTFMSIYNTGKYRWSYDNSDEKIKYIRWERYSQAAVDSILRQTESNVSIQEKIGNKFNYFELRDINGKTYSGQDLKGKILVINFWFVGCGPCEIEMPELNELVNQYQNHTDILFISFSRSSESKTKKFLSRKKFSYQTVSMDEVLKNEFRIPVYPTNYVIGKDGTYQFASKGIGAGSVTLINKKIKELLGN